jgi:hypothetical protein
MTPTPGIDKITRIVSSATLGKLPIEFRDLRIEPVQLQAQGPSGATASLISVTDAKSARRRSNAKLAMAPTDVRHPIGCSQRLQR